MCCVFFVIIISAGVVYVRRSWRLGSCWTLWNIWWTITCSCVQLIIVWLVGCKCWLQIVHTWRQHTKPMWVPVQRSGFCWQLEAVLYKVLPKLALDIHSTFVAIQITVACRGSFGGQCYWWKVWMVVLLGSHDTGCKQFNLAVEYVLHLLLSASEYVDVVCSRLAWWVG